MQKFSIDADFSINLGDLEKNMVSSEEDLI